MCKKVLIHFGSILCLGLFVSSGWCAVPIVQLLNSYSSGGYGASAVALADVNGDGKLDMMVANSCVTADTCSSGGTVGVLLGNGDGSFQPVQTYSSGGQYASWVMAQDLNGDGKLDVIVANRTMATGVGGIGILFGNGDGTFQPVVSIVSGGSPVNGVAVADLNHDGIPDIAIANWTDQNWYYGGSITVLLGAGAGKFQAAQTFWSGGTWTNSVAAADVNGDGVADLLVGNEGFVSVLLGIGDGTFRTPVRYRSGGSEGCWVLAADMNSDGKLDLVVANQFGPNRVEGYSTVGILFGNGDGTFQPVKRSWTATEFAFSLVLADLNRDNKADILVTAEKLVAFWGQGDGTIRRAPLMPFSRGTVAAGDVDGDTRTDIIQAADSQLNVLRNVIPFVTTTALAASVNPVNHGQPVTLTAQVVTSGPYDATGKVKFRDGSKVIGTATLHSGVATLTKSNLAVGTHHITALYAGDADSDKSTSPAWDEVVQ